MRKVGSIMLTAILFLAAPAMARASGDGDVLKDGSAVRSANAQAAVDPSPVAVPATVPVMASAAPQPIPEESFSATPALRTTEANSTNRAGASPAPPQASDQKLGPIAVQDFKIGVTFYGGWSYYNSTGFGQQFLDTPTEQLPPGNDGFNTFEVNRAYVNFLYTPNDHVALRITPDIYRQADGSYAFRLKYGYVDFQKIFGNGAFKNDKITLGQTQQPLTDWEEGLSGYRYAYLTPWNFLSLSSTYDGVKLHGPIEFNGREFLDYDLGVFNTASFHAIETDENKQFMVRATFYPFGTTVDRTGLGFTIFNNYGYKTVLPSAPQTSLDRLAAVVFYQTHSKGGQIAFEYDWGHNAYATSNLFNGAGTPSGSFAPFAAEAATILAGNTYQQGFSAFGHIRLGTSPFSLWGLWEYFKPNTDFDAAANGFTDGNPLDWERIVGGISFAVTKQFDIAFGDENWHWVHAQGAVLGAPAGPDTNGIVIWTQFNF